GKGALLLAVGREKPGSVGHALPPQPLNNNTNRAGILRPAKDVILTDEPRPCTGLGGHSSDVSAYRCNFFVPFARKDARFAPTPHRRIVEKPEEPRLAHETRRRDHQTLQTGRGAPGADGHWCPRHDGHRGQRLWPPEGPHRDLSRCGICRELPAK